MKITSPVKSKEFVERIIKAGAGELFGGVIDPIWQNKYGKYIEFNRRGSYGKQGNCQSYQEIGEIIQIADDYGVELSDLYGEGYTKGWLEDNTHPAGKGWIEINEKVYEFFNKDKEVN